MPNRYRTTGHLTTRLRTGAVCKASYSFRDDGRLTIRCEHAYPSPAFLSPTCDPRVIQVVAQSLLDDALERMGLIGHRAIAGQVCDSR